MKYLFIYRELKTKKGKRENLIVLITPNNYDFSVSDHYISPLRKFRKYDNKNFFKFLIVEGSNYVFATYEAVRYNFISLENYNNIVYVIAIPKEDTISAQERKRKGTKDKKRIL